MTIKFLRTGTPATLLTIADDPKLTVAAGADVAFGMTVVLDGDVSGYGGDYQVIWRTGDSSGTGAIIAFWQPLDGTTSPGTFYFQIGSTTVRCRTPAGVAGGAYEVVLQRQSGNWVSKFSPILKSAPTDTSSIVTSTAYASSNAMDGTAGLIMGNHSLASRRSAQSVGRFFRIDRALSDSDIAQLAYGKEITSFGVPAIYMRMNDQDDYQDTGSQANTVTPSGPLTKGSEPGYGFNSTPTAPVFSTKPSIVGAPIVGSPTSFNAGNVSGNPTPTMFQQWSIDGVDIAGATGSTYTPVASDSGKALRVRQTANNSQGSVSSTSDPATVSTNAVDLTLTSIVAERIYQRINGSAVVALSGSYVGTTPSRIEYQIYSPDGVSIIKAWANSAATISAGNWSASPSIAAPTDGRKYKLKVRSVTTSGDVIFTSDFSPRFGVGDIILVVGSSSPAAWFGSGSGSGMTPDNDRTSTVENNVWGLFGQYGRAGQMSGYVSASEGVPVAMINCALGGSSLSQWADNTSSNYKRFSDMVALVGGKISGVFGSAGSNDITSSAAAVTVAAHYAKLTAFADNMRATTGQSSLPILWRGINRRTDALTLQANNARTAERNFGDYPNIYHVQVLDLEVSSDGVHPTGAGYAVDAARCQYVWAEARKGNYLRGPKITRFGILGSNASVTLQHQGSTDFSPTTGITGFTAYDAQGAALTVTSASRAAANRINLVVAGSPARIAFLEGEAPAVGTPPFGNTSQPLPMMMEAYLASEEDAGTTPPPDTTAPTFPSGATVSVTNITENSAVINIPVASDNVAVTAYQYSIDAGLSYTTITGRTATITGLESDKLFNARARAMDAVGNVSSQLVFSFRTLEASTIPPDPSFIRSKQRTINIKATPGQFSQDGSFWNLAGTRKPIGSIDPNSTIDITFNWTDVLADIQDTIANVQFDIIGLSNKGSSTQGAFATIFVSNATANPSITCRITTASTPPRVEDRTVYLIVEQQ